MLPRLPPWPVHTAQSRADFVTRGGQALLEELRRSFGLMQLGWKIVIIRISIIIITIIIIVIIIVSFSLRF